MANIWHIISVVVLSVVLVAGLAWWMHEKSGNPSEILLEDSAALQGPLSPEVLKIANPGITNGMNRIATFNTSKGAIVIELYEDQMPITTGNFIKLAEEGFYNGTKFHRVIDNFMIQGGDPLTRDDTKMAMWGTGGPGYTFADEIGPNNKNDAGTISMANAGPNTNGSQFFINTADNKFLDGKHTVFGKVVAGMEVMRLIENTPADSMDRPIEKIVIENISFN